MNASLQWLSIHHHHHDQHRFARLFEGATCTQVRWSARVVLPSCEPGQDASTHHHIEPGPTVCVCVTAVLLRLLANK